MSRAKCVTSSTSLGLACDFRNSQTTSTKFGSIDPENS